MPQIKNLHLLSDIGEKEKTMMEHAGVEHARHSNITFKIQEVDEKKVVFLVAQGKSPSGNYFSKNRLIEIVHETFGRFFTGARKILVHPVVYKEPEVNVVDPVWVRKAMLDTGVKLKNMAEETGLDKSQLSSVISGDRPISQPMKAMLYYYFQAKK